MKSQYRKRGLQKEGATAKKLGPENARGLKGARLDRRQKKKVRKKKDITPAQGKTRRGKKKNRKTVEKTKPMASQEERKKGSLVLWEPYGKDKKKKKPTKP